MFFYDNIFDYEVDIDVYQLIDIYLLILLKCIKYSTL